MKTAQEVSAQKLRGGFYTPDPLVAVCLRRIEELMPDCPRLRLLEPSAGDGAFLRGLARSPWPRRLAEVTAIEPLDIEAEKARRSLASGALTGRVLARSAISWAAETVDEFDVAVGNPPFVRYQFIDRAQRQAATDLAQRLGVQLAGVANLWIPVLLSALSRLRDGGAFAFVVPTECLTGCSAAVVRRWLLDHCDALRFDLFPPDSFPAVLQEVTVLSGRRRRGDRRQRRRLRLVEHLGAGAGVDWSHEVDDDGPWTKYLLAPAQVAALDAAADDDRVVRLGDVVAFEVSIVTGANDFFTIDTPTRDAYALERWARPLLPRIRHAPGLRYADADHAATREGGARSWVLDFAADAEDPRAHELPSRYLEAGRARGLPARYKCRIRDPWFRVPGIRAGELLLSKRCHRHPRVVVNDASVFTTDTIYRGRMLDPAVGAGTIAANFHNSLSLLSAELEGRSFGGGVLELVPSEIARLVVHRQAPEAGALARLDAVARGDAPEALVAATDADLVARGLVDADVLATLAAARARLLGRRLARNRRVAVRDALDERPAA